MTLFYWLEFLLPFVIGVTLLIFYIFYSRKQPNEPGQRAWLVGSGVLGVVIFIIVEVVASQQTMSPGALGAMLSGSSALIVASSIIVLWRRRRAGTLLLALDTATSWYGRPWFWYGTAALWGILGLFYFAAMHDLPWLIFGVSCVICALVAARGRRRLEVREDGLFPAANGYTPWSRVIGYTLDGTTLTVRLRPFSVLPSWAVRVELRCSPAERQALRQELDRHLPAIPHQATPTIRR